MFGWFAFRSSPFLFILVFYYVLPRDPMNFHEVFLMLPRKKMPHLCPVAEESITVQKVCDVLCQAHLYEASVGRTDHERPQRRSVGRRHAAEMGGSLRSGESMQMFSFLEALLGWRPSLLGWRPSEKLREH